MENSKKQIVIFTQSKFSFRFLLQCPSVGDHFTNNFLSSLTSKYVWIGGYKDESQGWSWSDGTRWRYNSWSDGQPSNGGGIQHHLAFNFQSLPGGWNDENLNAEKGFICKYAGAKNNYTNDKCNPYTTIKCLGTTTTTYSPKQGRFFRSES